MQKTILILAANPKNTQSLDFDKEVEGIQQELNRPPRDEQFVVKQQWAATPDDVRHAMLDHQPHFVHFSGHGAGERGIVLQDENEGAKVVSTEALTQFFGAEAFANLECIILNACHTALQASAIVRYVDFVIGMNQPIGDEAAIKFSIGFYDALATGQSIEAAFEVGCSAISMDNLSEGYKPILKKRLTVEKRFWDVPIPENNFFTGRETVLQKVHETLYLSQAAALCGIGGVGKTQTAAHFAYLHRHEYQAVLWTLADTVESLYAGLAAMARILELPEKDFQKQSDMIDAVKHWLETHNDWLLILDNADDVSLMNELRFLFKGVSQGCRHLLLTSRATTTAPFVQAVPIEDMPREEGAKFLLYRAKYSWDTRFDTNILHWKADKIADWRMAIKIVKTLSGLPLALDQAGAYIRETQCGFKSYLERYQTHTKQLLEKRGTLITELDHAEPVAKTWLLSFKKIADENETAVEVLNLCAFLHPDSIPLEIFQDIDAVTLDEALRTIFKYSLLRRNPNTRVLSIHRLVQIILKYQMDETAQQTWAEKAVRAVVNAFPESGDYSNWLYLERLLPCAQMCAELITERDLVFEEAGSLLNQIGYYLDDKAEYDQAKPLYERALAIREKVFGEEHPDVATSLNNLALLYDNQGEYEQAKPLYERALAIYENVYGKEHPDVATDLNNLAGLYRIQGEYEQAKLLYERALAIREKVFGKEHPSVATSLNSLALLYDNQGEYEQAKPLYERALAIFEKVHGKEHPDVANSLWCLAVWYDNQSEYKQAKPLYEQALKIFNQVFKPDHPTVHKCSKHYADLLEKMKKPKTTKPPSLWKRLWQFIK
jgi:tetratricopeptide (TPR) repeat protein